MAAPARADEPRTREHKERATKDVVADEVSEAVASAADIAPDVPPEPAPVPEPVPEPTFVPDPTPTPEPTPEPESTPEPEPTPVPETPAPEAPTGGDVPPPEVPTSEVVLPEEHIEGLGTDALEEVMIDEALVVVADKPAPARRDPVAPAAAPVATRPVAPTPAPIPADAVFEVPVAPVAEAIDYLEVASVAAPKLTSAPPSPAAAAPTLVQSASGPRVSATEEYASRVLAGSLLPTRATGVWSTLGRAAARFGPWLMLLVIAQVVHGVARSALAEKLRSRRA